MPKNTTNPPTSRWPVNSSAAVLSVLLMVVLYFYMQPRELHTNESQAFKTGPITARVILKGESDVKGNLTLHQDWFAGPVHITGTISGLDKNSLRGFHVHSLGDLSDGCMSTGSHYNPFGLTHAAPEDKERHVGDLGNVWSGKDGVAEVDITDRLLSLAGPHSILGRALVVHTGTDDLGKGGHEDSKTTGHAGGRAACGVIGLSE